MVIQYENHLVSRQNDCHFFAYWELLVEVQTLLTRIPTTSDHLPMCIEVPTSKKYRHEPEELHKRYFTEPRIESLRALLQKTYPARY